MAKNNLPKWIEPRKMAEKGIEVAGSLQIAELTRLTACLASADGVANVKIMFALDVQGTPFMKGQLHTEVWLLCQRCMEPYQQVIDIEFILSPVTNDKEAAMLPNPYEPLLVENTVVELAAIVEDEILLSLPMIAMHRPENCIIMLSESNHDSERASTSERVNPFAVLASLKLNKH